MGGIVNVAANWGDIGGNFWEFQKAWNLGAAVGATAAFAGGEAGAAVAKVAGGVGAASGATAGAVGGFVGGAGNAWVNGASFNDGLKAGGYGALIGGVTGGIGGALEKNALLNNAYGAETASTEYAFNKTTGKFEYISNNGGDKTHFIRISKSGADGGWVAAGRTVVIDGNGIAAFRFMQTAASTTSGFIVPSTGLSGYGLEPRGYDMEWSGFDMRIPEGRYNLDEFTRPGGAKVPRLSNDVVPKARRILMHPGNYDFETSGCYMPGRSCGVDVVWNSNGANGMFTQLNAWINKTGHANVHFRLINAF